MVAAAAAAASAFSGNRLLHVGLPLRLPLLTPLRAHPPRSLRRCELIEDLRWRYGAAGLPADVRGKLSSAEADYARGYNEVLAGYVAASGIDITADLAPPRGDYVEVVALRNCGRLMTASGPREVKEREVHMVRKVDAEPLIRAGWLHHVPDRA